MGIGVINLAKKGSRRRKLRDIKKQQKGQIRSKKKMGKHVLNRMQFTSRANESMYDKLAMEFLEKHLPKIMDIVPKEVREQRGEEGKTPGKLFSENLRTINTKKTYVTRIKTFIKWNVINKGVSSLGEINEDSTREFIGVISDNIGTERDKYSTKTADSYIDGVYKFFEAVTREPSEAVTKLEGRTFGDPIESIKELKNRDFKQELRDMVPDYSRADYKRGKPDGYSLRDSQIIMRQAEKHMDIEKQLLVATLVYGGVRNDEAQNFSLDCYDKENRRNNMLKPYMNKQDRPRVVLDVDQKLFDLVEKYEKETGAAPTDDVFKKYSSDDVRDIVKECCKLGKIGYSGVHDLRKPYVEKIERDLFKKIERNEVSKHELVEKVMTQVGVDERLNPMVDKVRWAKKKVKGKTKWYPVKVGGKERKFYYEKLMNMTIENVAEIYVAEQLGHNKMETNMEYRGKVARERRENFREKIKAERKSGKRKF